MADDDDQLSDVDRKSLRILASTTKASGVNARLAERLERAAGTGHRADYEKAENVFNALEPESRRGIGMRAEKQAETEKVLIARRRKASKPVSAPTAEGAPLDWAPLSGDVPPPPPVKKPKPASTSKNPDGVEWELGRIPRGSEFPPPPVPKPRAKLTARPTVTPLDEPGMAWDFGKMPEDPVTRSRRERADAKNPFAELRRQMLGPDADT
ncbi:MAG: hypothetical protein HQ481_03515 [Alphaproteobacteria bacterium]|nr:hypothetical protein [Alphaproteobacteria bacterium]